jgi:hypothetical protein
MGQSIGVEIRFSPAAGPRRNSFSGRDIADRGRAGPAVDAKNGAAQDVNPIPS